MGADVIKARDFVYNSRCTGTNCDWASRCAVSLKPREYHERLLVPLKEYTAENCDIFLEREKAWGEGPDRD